MGIKQNLLKYCAIVGTVVAVNVGEVKANDREEEHNKLMEVRAAQEHETRCVCAWSRTAT